MIREEAWGRMCLLSGTVAKAWLCSVVFHWCRKGMSFCSCSSCGSRCVHSVKIGNRVEWGQWWKNSCSFSRLFVCFMLLLKQFRGRNFEFLFCRTQCLYSCEWSVVKSQILCTWIVGLEPFSNFAVSFGLCLTSNCVPSFLFSTHSSSRILHSRCLVSRQVFRQILYCWVSRKLRLAGDLQGGFLKPLLPGWAILELLQESV